VIGGERRKVTPADFVKAKKRGHRIVMVTAYDYYQARMQTKLVSMGSLWEILSVWLLWASALQSLLQWV